MHGETVKTLMYNFKEKIRYWNLMETLDSLFGEVALEDDMDQSQDRLRVDEWVTNRNVAKLYFAFVKCRV
jgi:hypothetical protein